MKFLSFWPAILLVALCTCSLQAQDAKISGVVTDEKSGEPLIGVTVSVVGTARGTATDFDGKYTVTVSPTETQLRFSYTGYNAQTVAINGRSVVDVKMGEDNDVLKEVVIVGYGTQKKSDLTGAVSSVRGSDLVKIPSSSAEQALQGKVAGVQVSSTSGAPGAVPVIRVRGVGTFNNSSPIFVVDGVILDNISFLSSGDIESNRKSVM